jgi:hypothetical protein
MENLDAKTEVKRRVFNSLNLPNFISNHKFDSNIDKNTMNDSIGFDLFKKEMNKVNYLNQTTANTIRAISHDSIKSLACCLRYNFSSYNSYNSATSSSSSVNLVKPVALRPKKTLSSNESSVKNSQNIPELLPTSMSFSFSSESSFVQAYNRNSKFVDRRSFCNNDKKLSNSISNQNISTRPHLNLIKMKISNLNESQKLSIFVENSKIDETNCNINDDSQTTKTIRKQKSSLNDDSYTSNTSKSSSLTSISNYSRYNSSDIESLDLDQIEKDDLINV